MIDEKFRYQYCPILSVSPAETTALRELPSKDKNLILPVFPIKSWASANKLNSSLERIQSSLGENNYWIADIDRNDLIARDDKKYREVHHEITKLIDPRNGYKNWCRFVAENKFIIPCLQLQELAEFDEQLNTLDSLGRGIVVILSPIDIQAASLEKITPSLRKARNLLVILDLEQITRADVESYGKIKELLLLIQGLIPNARLSLSSTSFPDSFGGYYKGCISIHERAIFDKIRLEAPELDLIYSDRGSARAEKQSGGSGFPPPRIDYACRNEWHFIRRELATDTHGLDPEEKRNQHKTERKLLYTEIACEIMKQEYWEPELALYSNYLVEVTAKGDDFGIDSPQKATAVRINKHLHTQLYYDNIDDAQDTDDDWVD
ncbi:beta family protein [Idiomarina aquatica]|uniref:Protein beta n=1 Tax=Idiomarina aquatica TaxID=1327752 RepID=A0AA94JDH9_9GAMM|nr:protein beta [Idiomarina aquatica]RUO42423.1 protein beta [Idiomarina aquatica]